MRTIINRVIKPHLVSRMKVNVLKSSMLTKIFKVRYFSLNDLDKQLEKYLQFENGFFVELGANDGVNQSNTLFFERFRGWKGVLIEPFEPNYMELIRNRSSTNFFKNAACVGPTWTNPTVELVYSNLMTSTLGVNSDVLDPVDHANQGAKFGGGNTFLFVAPAFTLNSILIEAGAPSLIDLLSLDVEGVEYEILKGVDHQRFRFRYICVESRQFDYLQQYLLSQEYVYIETLSSHDYLFKNDKTIEVALKTDFS